MSSDWLIIGYFRFTDKKTNSIRYGLHLVRDVGTRSNSFGQETKVVFPPLEFGEPTIGSSVDVRYNDKGYVESIEYV